MSIDTEKVKKVADVVAISEHPDWSPHSTAAIRIDGEKVVLEIDMSNSSVELDVLELNLSMTQAKAIAAMLLNAVGEIEFRKRAR